MDKNKKRSKALLHKFVEDKLSKYVAPQRKNTPRGDRIGASRQKYAASVFLLTNMKQKEIAEGLKISHSVLRKWNTEEDFKALVEGHCREFLLIALQLIDKYVELNQKRLNEWEKCKLSISFLEFSKKDDNEILLQQGFSDSKGYSKKLLNTFANWIGENESAYFDTESTNYLFKVEEYFCINRYILGLDPVKLIGQEKMVVIDKKMLESSFEIIENILSSKKPITKLQKKEMQARLEIIKSITDLNFNSTEVKDNK